MGRPHRDPDFWNPKLRGPICLNPPAARSYLPLTIKKTELVLAGQSKVQMVESIKAGLDKKELPTLEVGAMAYMLSKEQSRNICGTMEASRTRRGLARMPNSTRKIYKVVTIP
jgi:hypothetical protein